MLQDENINAGSLHLIKEERCLLLKTEVHASDSEKEMIRAMGLPKKKGNESV